MHSNHQKPRASKTLRTATLALAAALAWTSFANTANADVKLPAIFSDNCVLQRETPDVAVWGWADPGEQVTVSLNGKSAKAAPDKDGKWLAKLPALNAGGPFTMTVAGKNSLTIKNVLVGEVWLCSGQSNMEMPIDWGAWGPINSPQFKKQMQAADFPQLRMFIVQKKISGTPATDVVGEWKICKPDMSMMKWSAIGYFFGRDLHQNLKTPVGIIDDSVGGTPIESWLSHDALVAVDPDKKQSLEWWDAAVKKNEPAADAYRALVAKAHAAHQKPPAPGKPLNISSVNPWWPSSLYHGMILPLEPYTIRGVAWYQGESNGGHADYAKLLPALIANWRQDWGQPNLPFLIVQIANYQYDKTVKADQQTEPSEKSRAAVVRESQRKALAVPNTALDVLIDIGEARNIHPKNKQEAGRRLALLAEKLAYGQSLVANGPLLESSEIKGPNIILHFTDVGAGLQARDGGDLKGFAIAGPDKKFVWATAKIDGKTLVVSSDKITSPVAVRYDWADNPIGNLINKEGLPASPFATDNWTFESPPATPKK